MDRDQISEKYKILHQALEDDFFIIVNKGTRTQHRKLKKGKTRSEFDVRHGELGQQCNAELDKLPPPRDLGAEIDELRAEIKELKKLRKT